MKKPLSISFSRGRICIRADAKHFAVIHGALLNAATLEKILQGWGEPFAIEEKAHVHKTFADFIAKIKAEAAASAGRRAHAVSSPSHA